MGFDPYSQWLEIPAGARPPDYYQLLGLPRFEASHEQVRQVVLERFGRVRRYQLGAHSELALRLQSELSAAADCLSDPARKQAYDRQLRQAVVLTGESAPRNGPSPLETIVAAISPSPTVISPSTPATSVPPASAAAQSPKPKLPVAQPLRPMVANPSPPLAAPQPISPVERADTASHLTPIAAVRSGDSAASRFRRRQKTSFTRLVSGGVLLAAALLALAVLAPYFTRPVGNQPVAPSAENVSSVGNGQPPTDVPSSALAATANGASTAARSITSASQRSGDSSPPSTAIAPFDAATAKKHQDAWSAHLNLPVEKEFALPGGVKLIMVLIPPGEFFMGSTAEEQQRHLVEAQAARDPWAPGRIPSEGPPHRVRISRPFYLGKYEVTQAQWQALMGSNPSASKDAPTHPVEKVSWLDLQPFLAKLNADGATSSLEWTLPTEAQWEFACRAGTITTRHAGNAEDGLLEYGWFMANSGGKTRPMGQLRPNAFGLYDLYGNAWEWCADWWTGQYDTKASVDDPRGALNGQNRVHRGGSCYDGARHCRSANRGNSPPHLRNFNLGFRLAAAIEGIDKKMSNPALVAEDIAAPAGPGVSAPPPLAKAPFDAQQARALQAAWAHHLGISVETTNRVGAKMILIPPGEFMMGSTDEQVDAAVKVAQEINAGRGPIEDIQSTERPQHRVVITKPFLLGVTEVTVGQFKQFAASTGYLTEAEAVRGDTRTYRNPGHAVTDESPAAKLTWNDALAYCSWLSEQARATYRLPTEAEWEYACRAGTTTQYSFGDDHADLANVAWYGKTSGGESHRVGLKMPNAFGLFDMHGNVFEWCHDFREMNWYANSLPEDPTGPSTGTFRVLRGGDLGSNVSACRSARREVFEPLLYRYFNLGFRCVRVIDAPGGVVATPTAPASAGTGK